MSSHSSDTPSSGGLGQSSPLVTIPDPPNLHGGIRNNAAVQQGGIAMPAGKDHPLASSSDPSPSNSQGTEVQLSTPPVLNTADLAAQHVSPTVVVLPPAPVAHASANVNKQPRRQTSRNKTSLDELADDFLSEVSYRTTVSKLPPMLNPPPLPNEVGIARLRTLVDRRAWGDVLQIAGDMLRGSNSPHAGVYTSLIGSSAENEPDGLRLHPLLSDTIEALTLQCHGWLKLRRYKDLGREVDQWNFVTFNDAHARSPSWIPWSLHILAAETLQYTDEPDRAFDALYALRARIPEEEKIALASLENALSNAFVRQKQWRLALIALDALLETVPAATDEEVRRKWQDLVDAERRNTLKVLSCAYRCEVISRQGRVLLQVGAVSEATTVYQKAKTEWASLTLDQLNSRLQEHAAVKHIRAQLYVNEGLLSFADSKFDQALEFFRMATAHLRAMEPLTPKYRVEQWLGPAAVGIESHNEVFSESINNMALCALYTCRMREAVQLLESLIREDPTSFMTERVAFNLCTLYELGGDSAASARKKSVLQIIAKRFFLHDIGPESFRVS